MTFSDYQKRATTTNTLDLTSETAAYYFALGLTGESGEVAEKLKKVIRNHNGDLSKLDIQEFKKELGDVLWYLSMLATFFEIPLEDVANTNLAKLADRQARSVIRSTGDNR